MQYSLHCCFLGNIHPFLFCTITDQLALGSLLNLVKERLGLGTEEPEQVEGFITLLVDR